MGEVSVNRMTLKFRRTGDDESVITFLPVVAVVTDPETGKILATKFYIPNNFVLGEQ